MKLIFNPPFGDGAVSGRAQITSDNGSVSPPTALSLASSKHGANTTASAWTKTLTLVVGQVYPLLVWIRVVEDVGSGSLILDDGVAAYEVAFPVGVTADFVLYDFGEYTPQAATVQMTLQASPPPGNGQATWAIDDFELQEAELPLTEEEIMALDREPIYAALFARLQANVPGFVTMSRRLKTWDDISRDEQPALYLATGDQTPVNRLGVPPTWMLEAFVYMYFRLDEPTEMIPSAQLNAALTAIENALEAQQADFDPSLKDNPFFGQRRHQTTLGGLVQYAWMLPALVVEGIAQGQAAVRVPIQMLAAA